MQSDSALTDIKQDRLGRNEFAVQIANGLVNSFKDNHESIVIGINGEWGSGKSTLVNFVVQEIEEITKNEDYKPVIIRFNPWMFSGQKELQIIFLKEMYLVIKKDLGFVKKHAKKLTPLLESFELLINTTVFLHNPTLVTVSSRLTGFFKNFILGLNKVEDVHTLKEDIDKSIIETGLKIYITIDDIDRLNPTEITEILQMVKLNANFANTVFILCYDYDVVVSALKNKFGENGEKYLEKIVQVDYTLPHISKDKIRELFVEEMGKLFDIEELNTELKDFAENNGLTLPFFSTLRDMYRFLNAVKLRLEFIYEEVYVLDFLLIETLRIFDKKAYQFVIDNKDRLVQQEQNFLNSNSNPKVIELDGLLPKSAEIIERRFYLKNKLNNYGTILFKNNNKEISNRHYFDRYFSLNLSANDIPEKYFTDYFNSQEKHLILEKVNSLYSMSKFMIFLKRRLKSTEDIKETIFAIFLFIGKYNQPNNRDITVYYDFWDLLKKFGLEEAREILIEVLNMTPFNNYHLKICSYVLREYRQGELNDYYFLLRKDDDLQNFTVKLENIYNNSAISILQKIIKNKNELYQIEFKNFISYTIYDSKEHNEKLKHNFITFEKTLEDEYLMFVLDNIMKLMQASTYSQISERHSFRITKHLFPYWLESEYVKERLDKLDKENLSLEEQNLIKVFYIAYENNFDENKYYDFKTGTDVSEHFRRGR